jgi:hypothetical protein
MMRPDIGIPQPERKLMKIIIEAIGWATVLVLGIVLIAKLFKSLRKNPREARRDVFAERW